MRYILKDGYIDEITFGATIECKNQTCTEYTGTIPNNYSSLEEWASEEIDKLNAWKIVDGNLVFDKAKYNDLKTLWDKQTKDNSYVQHKELFEIQKQLEDIQDISESQYKKTTSTGKVITIDNVKKIYPKIKLTNIDPYSFSKIDLIVTGRNILKNEAISQTINGLEFTQNEDRSITINGKATAKTEYNIAGTSLNTSAFLCFKKDFNCYLSGLKNLIMKMYHYNGTDREEVYSGTDGIIKFTDSDKLVTQITLDIPSGTTIDNLTIYPQLEYGSSKNPYEMYEAKTLSIDFSEYIGNALYPSETLYPSGTVYPRGITIDYILIEDGSIIVSTNGKENNLGDGKISLFDGYDVIYAFQDTNIEIEYCINELDIDNLDFMCGKETTNKKFKISDDASIQVNNIYQYEGGKILGGDGLITSIVVESNIKSKSFIGGSMMLPMGYSPLYYDSNGNLASVKDDLMFEFTLPKGFVIKSAFITLHHMPVDYKEEGVTKYTGYSRNLKLYKADTLNGKASFDYGYFNIDFSNVSYSEINGAFGNNGFTGSSSQYTKQKSIDIKNYINTSNEQEILNILKIETGNSLVTSEKDMYQQTGSCKASLVILGYTKFE